MRSRLAIGVAIFVMSIGSPSRGDSDRIGEILIRSVKHVESGDTLVLDTPLPIVVRLRGIEAPPVGRTCEGHGGARFPSGDRAKLMLSVLTAGKTLVCEIVGEMPEGTPITSCRSDGADIGRLMVITGMARANRADSEGYERDEDTANENRIGLWGECRELFW